MSQRLHVTKWFWYILAVQTVSTWTPVRSLAVRKPPNNPSTIEAQAKFFQDFFSVQLSPYKIEFGHVCEDPDTWEQRYEKKDFKNHRDMGKVRWGDKKGGYGEHYWDLNHAGHAGNHGNDGYESDSDDGSYHENDNNEHYNEPSENTYGTEEYDPERASYEENGRAKRAHQSRRVPVEKKVYEDEGKPKKQKNREILQTAASEETDYSEEESYVKQRKPHHRKEQNEEHKPKSERNQLVLVVTKKDDDEEQPTEAPKRLPESTTHYVPYEGGAGVRQHQHPDVTAAATVPRLFLESSTGHVVDRATGQAYVLQPIAVNRYN